MNERRSAKSFRQGMPALAFVVGLIVCAPLSASDAGLENEKLALLIRQLNLLERTAQQSASLSEIQGNARYYFDYARLRADLARIRSGIEDYLTPQRAQPRDPDALDGQYRRAEGTSP